MVVPIQPITNIKNWMLTLFYRKLGWPLRSHFILIDHDVRINNMVILKHIIFFEIQKQLGFDDTLKMGYTILISDMVYFNEIYHIRNQDGITHLGGIY